MNVKVTVEIISLNKDQDQSLHIAEGSFQGCLLSCSVSSNEVKDNIGAWQLFASEGSEVQLSPLGHNKHLEFLIILNQVMNTQQMVWCHLTLNVIFWPWI